MGAPRLTALAAAICASITSTLRSQARSTACSDSTPSFGYFLKNDQVRVLQRDLQRLLESLRSDRRLALYATKETEREMAHSRSTTKLGTCLLFEPKLRPR